MKINYFQLSMYLAIFMMGMFVGVLLQQSIIQSSLIKVASNMDGVEINVNFNESKFTEDLKNFYEPYLQSINQSVWERNETKEELIND